MIFGNMRRHNTLSLLTLLGFGAGCWAQSSSQSVIVLSGTNARLTGDNALPTGSGVSYLTYDSTRTVYNGDMTTLSGTMSLPTSFVGASNSSTTTPQYTLLAGGTRTLHGTNSATTTTTSATPTNTQPCNGYPEFCARRYSNITEVCAHNSPFVQANNAGSNQQLDVTTQLNDGIRMLQGQTHKVNGTLYYCHTSCDLLNGGTVQDYLTKVNAWVQTHPYDIVTIVIGNGDLVDVNDFVAPIQNSGIGRWLYQPPKVPMSLNDWPTLSYMILMQKRVVMFMDYKADQGKVPYILDQFSQLWETPFSPTDVNFPCNAQRPPGLSQNSARQRMYMANHNLNTEVTIGTFSLLIPNYAQLNMTNGVNGTGSVGLAVNNCISDWGRPPNFLLVDYYNFGSPINGSVFQVAATANNVTYHGGCCGNVKSSANRKVPQSMWLFLLILVGARLLF